MNIEDQSPLKWPSGWERTRIQDRKANGGWKKTLRDYRAATVKELQRMGVAEIVISFNQGITERLDPGVAVYFSKSMRRDYSWQDALGLLTPAPTLQEIDNAFREKAMIHHPDRGGDIETFKKLQEHRERARAWVMGTEKHEHEYVIPCDRFTEVRLNLAAIRLALAAFRSLERVGVPSILERTFLGFRTAIAEHATEGADVAHK